MALFSIIFVRHVPVKMALITNIALDGKPEYATADGRGHVYANIADKAQIAAIDTKTNTVTAHWPLSGCTNPHGLAVDAAGRRIFSSCPNGKLMVVNADTGAIVAVLPIGLGTDSAAYDPSHHRIFSSNGGSGTLSVIVENSPDNYSTPWKFPPPMALAPWMSIRKLGAFIWWRRTIPRMRPFQSVIGAILRWYRAAQD